MPGTATFSGFGGGGGGPNIMKELAIIAGVWISVKYWVRSNRPPPPDGPNTRFNRHHIPPELYKYEKSRVLFNFA
jgi:hypothetical protein